MFLKKLFYYTFFVLCLGQLTNVTRSEGLNIYAFDFFILTFGVLGSAYFMVKSKFDVSTIFFGLLLFCTVGALTLYYNYISSTLNERELLNSAFYLVRFISYILSGVVVYNMVRTGILTKESVFNSIVFFGVFVSVLGFAQIILLPDFETLDPSLGWDPHKSRLASTFFDPNFVGGFLCICFAVLLNKFYLGSWSKSDPLWAVLITVAIFLTFSRSSWAMYSIIILIYGLFKDFRIILAGLVIAFSAYFFVPRVQTRISGVTDPADSAHFRLISWQNSLKIIEDNWLLGVGFNAYRYTQQRYGFFEDQSFGGNAGAGTDSSFLFVLATTGILGLIIFAITFAKFALPTSDLLSFSVGGGLLLHSQFVNSIFYPQILFLILLLIAIKKKPSDI